MKLYCIQLNSKWEDKPANFARVRELVAKTTIEPNSLLLLPEMFATGFSLNTAETAEPINGPTQLFLADLAKETKSVVLGGLARSHSGNKSTNRALAYSPEGHLLADYAKLHPFSFGKESQHFSAGEHLITFTHNDFVIAPTICYDLRFPELYRRAMQKGATLITVIASWPIAREHHWITLLQARAIENQCFIAGCNRTGADPYLAYGGRSLIIDPTGQLLADAGFAEGITSADLNLQTLQTWRTQFPALQDLRKDLLPP